MATCKYLFIFGIVFIFGARLQAQLQMRDIYSCLVPLDNLEYLSTVQQQLHSYQEIKSKKYPSLQLQLAKEYNATNSPSTSTSAFVKLAASQIVYDRKVNSDINSAEAHVDSIRYSAAHNKIILMQKAVENIADYYLLKEKRKIVEQKIDRQASLISVLHDLVSAKSTDGVLLTLSESDLSILKIKLNELNLQIQRAEKSFFISEKLRKLIIDDTVFMLALKVGDQRTYQKLADKMLLLSWESRKKEIEFKKISLTQSLYPKLNFGVDYYTYLEERSQLRLKDDFLLSVSLTIPISDLYTLREEQASQLKSLQFIQMALNKSRFDLSTEDQFNIERVKQINQSIKELNSIKLNIIKAKYVISKKLLVNKASYNDYIQIDDRVDEVEMQISTNQLEKTKLLMFNEIESIFSNESLNSNLFCNL